eukprot:XP_015576475.1 endonuclease V isoform X2 [Ricinus communis]
MHGSGGEASSSSSTSTSTLDILRRWKEIQYSLKQKLILEDDVPWKLPASSSSEAEDDKEQVLKYVGGVDVSCLKEDQSIACGTLVVLDFFTGKVLYHDSAYVKLDVPYIAGFLAFREAPVLVQLLEKMKNDNNPHYPQLVMVDGNGVLHPRGFGLACHLGVLENLPTIGIGKKLHCVDGLTKKGVTKCLQAEESSGESFITLTGRSGRIYGAAMRSTEGSVKPIFISIGHRVSLDTAIKIVKMSCKYRVPEPIRQEPGASWETITGHPPFNELRENTSQVQNGSAEIGQGTFQGRGRGQGRRGPGRGRWQDRGQVENGGEGQRWQDNQDSRRQSDGRDYSRGRGRGGGIVHSRGRGIVHSRGRGRCQWGNSCEYAWVRKDLHD